MILQNPRLSFMEALFSHVTFISFFSHLQHQQHKIVWLYDWQYKKTDVREACDLCMGIGNWNTSEVKIL